MTENFWEQYEKATQAESGGGGIIAECIIETGYKAYVSGSQEDSWFPCPPTEESMKDTKKKADSYAKANGAERAKWGVQIKALLDGAYSAGQPATWQGDRFFNRDSWTEDESEKAQKKGVIPVLIPSLRENGVALPFRGWCRLGIMPDPVMEARGEAGKTKKDRDGNPTFPTVTYVTEVFDSKEAAYAALGVTGDATPAAVNTVPAIYDAETWASVIPDIKASTDPLTKLAADYQVTVADIVRARNS